MARAACWSRRAHRSANSNAPASGTGSEIASGSASSQPRRNASARQREQRQHQPRPLVAPFVGGAVHLLQRPAPRIVHPGPEQPVDVGIVRGDHGEPPLAGPRPLREAARRIDARHDDLATHALEKTAFGQRHRPRPPRCPPRAPTPGCPRPASVSAESRVRGPFTPSVTEDDLAGGGPSLLQQLTGHRKPEIRSAPLHGDDAGVDGRQQVDERVRVPGERGHEERIAPRTPRVRCGRRGCAGEDRRPCGARATMREGARSRVSIERDTSRANHPGCEGAEHRLLEPGRTPVRPARARRPPPRRPSPPMATSRRGVPAPTRRWGSRAGSTIGSHEPLRFQRRRSHHTSASPGGIATSHQGRTSMNSVIAASPVVPSTRRSRARPAADAPRPGSRPGRGSAAPARGRRTGTSAERHARGHDQ